MTQSRHIARFAHPVWHAQLAQAIDRLSIESGEITGLQLMENAARAVADTILETPDIQNKTVIVLAGNGNNGGDGLAVARLLLLSDVAATVFVSSPEQSTASEGCKHQLELAKKAGVAIRIWSEGAIKDFVASRSKSQTQVPWSSTETIIVDALLGIGFNGTIRPGPIKEMLVEAAAVENIKVIAVDLPSGMNPDNGSLEAECSGEQVSKDRVKPILCADITVTFGGLKPALALAPSRDFCGFVKVAEIGFPPSAIAAATRLHPAEFVVAQDDLLVKVDPWAELPLGCNKFDRGHILVLGGSEGKTGAPFLAGLAALRAGAGWVTLSLPPDAELNSPNFSPPPEITYEPLWNENSYSATLLAEFIGKRKVRAIVIGPGTVSQPITDECAAVLARFTLEGGGVVIDAGALHNIIPLLQKNLWNADRVICTPHPGEWLKLSDDGAVNRWTPLSPAGVLSSKKSLQQTTSGANFTIVYKGATPVILDCNSEAQGKTSPAVICAGGSKVLARAGTGDVIAGVVAAHLAMAWPANTAFARSYALVCKASTIAALKYGENAVLASDIIGALGLANRNEAASI